MNNKNVWITGAVIIIIVVAALAVSHKNSKNVSVDNKMIQESSDKKMMSEENKPVEEKMEEPKMEKEPSTEAPSNMQMSEKGTYVDYSESTIAEAKLAVSKGRKAVLFFHAPWCPYCKAANAAFNAGLNTGNFPSNVTLLKTDYDSNTELKKKYGVTYQHTFVQIDKDGNLLAKWNGGDIDNLNKYIK